MIKIEAITLEDAYSKAASELSCSITELNVEVVQYPVSGFLGMFKKSAIIVATVKVLPTKERIKEDLKKEEIVKESVVEKEAEAEKKVKDQPVKKEFVKKDFEKKEYITKKEAVKPVIEKVEEEKISYREMNDTIMPESFVTGQDDDEFDEDDYENSPYRTDYTKETSHIVDSFFQNEISTDDMILEIKSDLDQLFKNICFKIDDIAVSMYDENSVLVEFSGDDAALLIGKEGYRYKALSYMIFNWINAKYDVQLRLEIAEFLKNQEENINRYLESVYESVDRDGRAQTKILDGVLIQIALKQLRDRYTDKYVAIRSTRDGNRYIIINDYNNH
jgi:spoIIIJ-associated protein